MNITDKGVGSFFELGGGGLNSGVDPFFGWGGGKILKMAKKFGALRAQIRNI